jgi:hypothetical protein
LPPRKGTAEQDSALAESNGAFAFPYPATKLDVQHWLDDDKDHPDNEHEALRCPACCGLNLVNRKTGELLAKSRLKSIIKLYNLSI